MSKKEEQRVVRVFVEGYEDVAFWRGVFDDFDNPFLCFDISVPTHKNLPKGKKILLSTLPESSERMLLCVDADFDHLFEGRTAQSREVNDSAFMFHTYTYATENYLCYAPSLHNVCVKATKNDTRVFDFERFMTAYSRTIYRLFLWYAYSALHAEEHLFTLVEFKAAVRLHYLDLEQNGAHTLAWLERQVVAKERGLAERHPRRAGEIDAFGRELSQRGVHPDQAYLYMHGHTLMDHVVLVLLDAVCERLRKMSLDRIASSSKEGVALENELSNYHNAQRSIRDVLLDNDHYTRCPLYTRLSDDIEAYVLRTLTAMHTRGEIDCPPGRLAELRQGWR